MAQENFSSTTAGGMLKRPYAFYVFIERLLFAFSALTLVIMMLLVSADVVARYLFNAPLTFQFELTTQYLMVIVATLSLPWGERQGAFIRLSVIRRFVHPRAAGYLDAANGCIAAAVFFALAWYSGARTLDAWRQGDAIFGVIDWPVWLSLFWVPVGCFMLGLRLAIKALIRMRDPLRAESTAASSAQGKP